MVLKPVLQVTPQNQRRWPKMQLPPLGWALTCLRGQQRTLSRRANAAGSGSVDREAQLKENQDAGAAPDSLLY
ncbi:hypothetical protein FQA47_019665 [Oryzias melastigma]|uniref:Uncharacterized protein n=1 Tax=Oryzias melastigma TaxID=30732 RepID=A0A834L0Q6_ORYME|nr:hypothetical protein FQA47_019665 [Oryzias melastigma]